MIKKRKKQQCKKCFNDKCQGDCNCFEYEKKSLDLIFWAGQHNPYQPDLIECQNLVIQNDGFTIQALNLTQVGTAKSQRIGNKIAMQKLEYAFNLFEAGNPTLYTETARILFVYDKQPNGVYPTIDGNVNTSILGTMDQTGAISTTLSCSKFINVNNSERFEILKDMYYELPGNSLTGIGAVGTNFGPSDQRAYNFKGEIDLENRITVYNNAALGGIGNTLQLINGITTGALYICVLGTQAGPAAWAYNGVTRLHFREA